MTKTPRYSRDELARLEQSLRGLAVQLDGDESLDPDGLGWDTEIADLLQTAGFLAETVGTLDKQRKIAQRKAAQSVIERKKRRRSR